MITLAIQTALKQSEWAIMDGSSIRAEMSTREPVDELSDWLDELIKKAQVGRNELQAIVMVKGPGSFTSLRSGIAFGNAIAAILKCPIFEISTLELLRLKSPEPKRTQVVLWSGGTHAVLWNGNEWKEGELAELLGDEPSDGRALMLELPQALMEEAARIAENKAWKIWSANECRSFATVLSELDFSALSPVAQVEPWYLHPPKITVSDDPLKQ